MDTRIVIVDRLRELVDKKWPGHGGRRLAAAALGYKESYFSRILNNEFEPTQKTLRRFADGLGVPLEQILGIKPTPAPKPTRPQRLAMTSYRLPIYGTAAAGKPIDVETQPDDWLEVSDLYPDDCFVVRIKGRSMEEHAILSGDWAIIRPVDDEADIGQKCLFWIKEEGHILKPLGTAKRWREGRKLTDLEPGDRIVGVFMGLIRKE